MSALSVGDRVRSSLVPDRGASSVGTLTSVNEGAYVVEWDDGTNSTVSRSEITREPSLTALYRCRDIGYGVEEGEVYVPPFGARDWTGKRAYMATDRTTVYLFDDEVIA